MSNAHVSELDEIRRRSGVTQLRENLHGKLDNFCRGYIIAMLWSSTDESDEAGGEHLDANYSIEDLSTDAIQQVLHDCKAFQEKGARLLDIAFRLGYDSPDGSGPEAMAGHDFWLTRNGHGAGFWDRTELDKGGIGDKLTELAKSFGEVYPYVGDDGQIHLS